MCGWRNSEHLWVPIVVVMMMMSLFLGKMHCQVMNDHDQLDNPAVLPLITQLVYSRLSNLTSVLSHEISTHSTFCVKDPWVPLPPPPLSLSSVHLFGHFNAYTFHSFITRMSLVIVIFGIYRFWTEFCCFRDSDWNQAFNFSSDLDFLASCIKKTKGIKYERTLTSITIYSITI